MSTADKATDLAMKYADEIERLRAALTALVSAVEADGDHFADDRGSDCSICAALHKAGEALK